MTAIRKSARKIGLIDKHAIGMSLEVAAVAVEPEEYSYRAVFREMMPKLYVMRQRGMSFPQLHRLLHQTGFPIALATLRTYYSECLLEMREECEQYLRKLDRVMGDVGEAADVDPAQLRAAKTAARSAVTAEGSIRAAATIRTFAAVDTTAGGAPITSAPVTGEATAPPQSPEPSTGPELSPARTPSHCKPQPPVVAIGTPVAAHAVPAATTAPEQPLQPLSTADAPGSHHCLTTPGGAEVEILDGLPPEVLSDAVLEHPAIPGLMLTRAQRLFRGRLEYRNAAGLPLIEKGTEMMNRRQWTPGVLPSVGRTSGDFVELDTSFIGRRRTG